MKAPFKRCFLALFMAITVFAGVAFSACTIPDYDDGQDLPTQKLTHTLTLHLNGGTLSSTSGGTLSGDVFTQKFDEGRKVTLPTPARTDYVFGGWFASEDLSGSSYSVINASEAIADKEFWAKWSGDDSGVTYTVTLHLNGGSFVNSADDITSYVSGQEKDLPVASKLQNGNKVFAGWYKNENFSGSAVTKISASDTGNLDFYAKWNDQSVTEPDVPVVSAITYNLNGGHFNSENYPKTYTEGEEVTLPTPAKSGYSFDGWYDNENCTGNPIEKIKTTDKGNKVFYAKWTSAGSPQTTYTLKLHLNGGTLTSTSGGTLTDGVFTRTLPTGTAFALPTPQKENFVFAGWFEDEQFSGTQVERIEATNSDDKILYAKWVAEGTSGAVAVLKCEGYEEGAFVTFTVPAGSQNYSVSYKKHDGVSAYEPVASELIRKNSTEVRADILGLAAGSYDIKVTVGNASITKAVDVTAYDRSGYAHFNFNDGVGAYKDDGTLKANAQIIYVTEATKNTVTAKINNTNYTGLVKILNNASKSQDPLVIRIVGTVGAATWKAGNVTYTKTGDKLSADAVVGKNGQKLPTDSNKLTQEYLNNNGYNELDTSVYSVLNDLSSKISYDSSKKEFDSAWNNCSISNAKNVTVEGVGDDARIFQWGFTWKNGNSIEVRNLTFEDYTEDACSFEGSQVNSKEPTVIDQFTSKNIWVHHNTFLEGVNYWDVCAEQDKHEGDGATDFKRNAFITISYNHYQQNHKTGLIGGGDSQTTASVTFHHNWYESCVSRLPLARQANMHMYNNYYQGTTGTNMSIRAGGYAFVEYCYFENANNPIVVQSGDSKKAAVKVFNCKFDGKQLVEVNDSNGIIKKVTSRTDKVTNQNIFNQNFDTDKSAFYYNESKSVSGVTDLITNVDEVPQKVKELAGVHH